MVSSLRNWLVAAVLSCWALLAQAQAQLPTLPLPPTTAPAVAAPVASPPAALLPPTGVPGNYKDYLYQRYATDKKACAVIRLFKRRQTGGAVWLSTGVVAISVIASQTGTNTTSSGTTTFTVSPLGYAALVGLFGGVGVGKLGRFSNQKLYQALAEYDRNGVFPYYVTSRIKKYYE